MHSVNNFLTVSKTGLYCPAGDFYLDPRRPVHKALVSHAHGDHAVPNSGTIYTTAPTQSLMNRRFRSANRSHFNEIHYGEPFLINEVKITFFPAGHMLGSAQVLLEFDGERYLYTGDFKLQADDSCEALEFVECDHLITETTFADPQFEHPDPVAEISLLNDTNQNILIGAYAIGKAQRITRLVANHCPAKTLYVHPELSAFHQIYERYGVELGSWQLYTRQEFTAAENAVCIVPPGQFMRHSRNKDVLKVFATGWKRSFVRCDRILPISDHADWRDVLTLVEKSKARHIYTVHGEGRHLKEHLSGSGIDVVVLN